jgi:hypothetical protein
MKLATYQYDGIQQPGVLNLDRVLPLNQAGFDDLLSLISGGDPEPLQSQVVMWSGRRFLPKACNLPPEGLT